LASSLSADGKVTCSTTYKSLGALPASAATTLLKSITCGAPVAHYCTTMQDDASLIPSKVPHGIFKRSDPISEDPDDSSYGSFE